MARLPLTLTRDLPTNRLAAAAGLVPESTTGDVFGAGFDTDTLTTLIRRQALINRDSTTIETVREPNGMTTLREVPRADAIPADTLNEQYKDLGVNFDRAMPAETAKIIADAKRAEIIRDDVMARGPGGVKGTAAGLAGGLAGMATDPLEIATAFVPVVSEARAIWLTSKLGRIGGRVGVGVIEGGVGNALTEPLYYGLSRSQHLDYTMSDSLLNIGLGAVLGGALGTGVGVAGRLGRGAEDAAVRAADGLSVDAPDVHLAEAPPAPKFDDAAGLGAEPPRGRVEVEQPDISAVRDPRVAMTSGERMAALRTAVGQMANGRAVEIAPTFPRVPSAILRRDEVQSGSALPLSVSEALHQRWAGRSRAEKIRDRLRPAGFPSTPEGRAEAARWLWDQGYLRDQPEAEQMLAAERGAGPAPDLAAAMDRAMDDEALGTAHYSVRDAEPVAALAETREAIRARFGPLVAVAPDRQLDRTIDRVRRGQAPGDAFLVELGFDPMRPAAAQVDDDYRLDDLTSDDLTSSDELFSTMIEDMRAQGKLTADDLASLAEADALMGKATAVREVARSVGLCLVSAAG